MENRNPTFQEVQSEIVKVPEFEEVKAFFNAEYNFLKKWMAAKEPDWDEFSKEWHDLDSKFQYKFFRERILSTFELIEKSYTERNDSNG